jgi:SAM-dependent methyltransferase
MDVIKVQGLIAQFRKLLDDLERELGNNPTVNVMVNAAAKIRVGTQEIIVPGQARPMLSTDLSKLIDLPDWPVAVEPDLLCDVDSIDEKIARAEVILDSTVETDIRDLRFLDYGCGEGWATLYAQERGAVTAHGYDPNLPSDACSEKRPFAPGVMLTNRPEDLVHYSYDVIFLYDVLDHCNEPLDVLHHVARLLAPGGTVYVSCHPWTSRHGGHLYRQLNKAFVHLYLDHGQLLSRGIKPEAIYRVYQPLKTYRQWFVTAGLTVKREEPRYSEGPLEPFFRTTPGVWDYLTRCFHDLHIDEQKIQRILELEFVTYVLQAETVF